MSSPKVFIHGWPTLYGTRYAKEYYSFAVTVDLAASAIGPILFSVIDRMWGIHVALWIMLPLPLANCALILLSRLLEPRPGGPVSIAAQD